jgi:hypothetical protein
MNSFIFIFFSPDGFVDLLLKNEMWKKRVKLYFCKTKHNEILSIWNITFIEENYQCLGFISLMEVWIYLCVLLYIYFYINYIQKISYIMAACGNQVEVELKLT